MQKLILILLCACVPSKIDDSTHDTSGVHDSRDSSDSGDTRDTSTVRAIVADISGFSLPKRDQVYDMEALPSAGVGCVLVGDPYYESFTGAVYLACPGSLDLPDDADAVWTGSDVNQALGCDLEVSYLSDGTELIGSSEFADPTYAGRGLMWPSNSAGGVAADVAVFDVAGDVDGDGFTGGYFGTMIRVMDDLVVVSQTNTVPYLLAASADDLSSLTLDDFYPLVDGGSVGVDTSTGGFAGYEASGGDDGLAVASYGGIVQHLTNDGTPDWWVDMFDSGSGEYPWGESNNATLWTDTTRLAEGEVVLSVLSRGARSDDEQAYALVIDPVTGETLEDHPDTFGIVGGMLDGVQWRVYGVEACDPNFDDCRYGYLRIESDIGDVDVSLPFESDTFPSGGCLLGLTSDNASEIGWFCKDRPYGGFLSISVE